MPDAMADCCSQADFQVPAPATRQRRVLIAVLGINVITFLMMVAGSLLSGSSSLLSGTLDNLGDALTYAMSLAAIGATSATKARVAFFKGLLILGAALAVAVQIAWRISNPEAPIATTMGIVAFLNLGANSVCLLLLRPHRNDDVNMSSVWECSRNDVFEGMSVIVAAGSVWLFGSAWPDLFVAIALLLLFLRSAVRVLRSAWREMRSIKVQHVGRLPL